MLGATVVEYGKIPFVPLVRFTFIDYGRAGARVAVATKDRDIHVINEYSASHPMFSLADDMVRITLSACERLRDVQKP
jgi:hypothetical protein